jgi:CheY-like chemotaxis protein/HPt (histidine-containing phosphotransfer) domain-containing protein
MGHRIDVASEPGKGSTFSVHFAGREAKTTVRRAPREEPSPVAPGTLRDRLILVVDDEEDSRFLLRQYIADCGCRVAEATAGPEAVRIARELRPDLITLDLMMPGMDGFQTLRGLKADATLRDIPVVVVSIVGRENRGTIFGAADVLNKPVSKEEICSVIRRNVRPGKNRVLVVDDDEGARQIIQTALETEPLEVRTAENGQDALLKMEEFPPDVVVLDLVMPVMDGMGFLGAIRRIPRWSSLPIVVATSKDLTNADLRQLETSVAVVLRKGDELRADLQRVIRGMLEGKHRPSGERIPVRVRKMVADMVPGFLENRRQDVRTILDAVARGDFDPIRVAGHNMKGVGSSYGFEPITEIGRRLEDAAKAGAAEEIRRQAAALGDYLDRVDVVPE